MRLSRYFLPILREVPKEAEIVSHRLMLRAGMVRQEGAGIYARQVERGNCVVGGERGLPLADTDFSRPTGEGALAIMNKAAELFPAMRHAQAIRFWTGTEAAMPDRNPVIGQSGTTPGLFHAFGFTGAGFQIAPGVGEVLAELVRDGATTTPIDAFSITRFSTSDRTADGSGADCPSEPQHRGDLS